MSAQNEPLDGDIPRFPFNAMGWTPETQRKFIADNLGPLLNERGYQDLHLMIMDDQRINLPIWPNKVQLNYYYHYYHLESAVQDREA